MYTKEVDTTLWFMNDCRVLFEVRECLTVTYIKKNTLFFFAWYVRVINYHVFLLPQQPLFLLLLLLKCIWLQWNQVWNMTDLFYIEVYGITFIIYARVEFDHRLFEKSRLLGVLYISISRTLFCRQKHYHISWQDTTVNNLWYQRSFIAL
jgi:hypothetical protein